MNNMSSHNAINPSIFQTNPIPVIIVVSIPYCFMILLRNILQQSCHHDFHLSPRFSRRGRRVCLYGAHLHAPVPVNGCLALLHDRDVEVHLEGHCLCWKCLAIKCPHAGIECSVAEMHTSRTVDSAPLQGIAGIDESGDVNRCHKTSFSGSKAPPGGLCAVYFLFRYSQSSTSASLM